MARTLSVLKEKGYLLGIITGKSRTGTEITLEYTNLHRYFRSVVTGTDGVKPEPDPEGLLLTAYPLGILPREMVYLRDTAGDIEAARAVGARAVLVTLYNRLSIGSDNTAGSDHQKPG